jgi:hypothetical protein
MTTVLERRLQQALNDLHTQKFKSIRAAAKAYDVPRSTLGTRFNGTPTRRVARVSQQLLSTEQEELLVQWILDLEKQGHPVTHPQVREMAELVSELSGGPDIVGVNWVARFIHRHPQIRTKVGVKIDHKRVDNTTPEAIEAWFDYFQRVQTYYQVDPANIWNMDETGIALGVCANQTVIGSSSSTTSRKKTPENREWVSILETVSTGGRRTRCLVIFKGKALQSTWFPPEKVPNWLFTTSENGWTSNDIGLRWLREIFLPETQCGDAPRILLCDGHGSHATIEFMWECYQNKVYLVYLIPHSSHVLQPLDLSVFSAVKTRYRQSIADLARWDDAAPIKKISFLEIYHKARDLAITPYNIRSGWQAVGIYPWNPRKVIRSSQVAQGDQTKPQTPQKESHKRNLSSTESVLVTPQNKRQLLHIIDQIQAQMPIPRPVRALLSKTGKAFDVIIHQQAQNIQQIEAQRRKLDQLQAKKKKKTAIDANKRFTDIVAIKAVHDQELRQRAEWLRRDQVAEARKVANELMAKDMTAFQFEWHVLDTN